jgi:hypothetical protein
VVQRAYTATYLESLVLSRMMLRMEGVVAMADWPEVSARVDLAQKGYRAALLDMRQVYDTLSDQASVFGFAPEYIPFPALEPLDPNAFKRMLTRAKDKLAIAALKEEAALAQSKSYEWTRRLPERAVEPADELRGPAGGALRHLHRRRRRGVPRGRQVRGHEPADPQDGGPLRPGRSGQIHAATEEVELGDPRPAPGARRPGRAGRAGEHRAGAGGAGVRARPGDGQVRFEAQEQIDAVAEQIKITELPRRRSSAPRARRRDRLGLPGEPHLAGG